MSTLPWETYHTRGIPTGGTGRLNGPSGEESWQPKWADSQLLQANVEE